MTALTEEVSAYLEQFRRGRRGAAAQAMIHVKELRARAVQQEDLQAQAFADYVITYLYYVTNQLEACLHYGAIAQESIARAGGKELVFAQVHLCNVLGLCRMQEGNYASAMDNLFGGLSHAQEAGDVEGIILTRFNLAELFAQLGLYAQALEELLEVQAQITPELLAQDPGVNSRRLLLSLCEGALYAAHAGETDVQNNQLRLLEEQLSAHPEEREDPNWMLLEAVQAMRQGDRRRAGDYARALYQTLWGVPDLANYSNETLELLELLRDLGEMEMTLHFLQHFEEAVPSTPAAGLMVRITSFSIEFYTEIGRQDLADRELRRYWTCAQKLRSQTSQALVELFNARTSLLHSERDVAKLRRLADTDALTGLGNRRVMHETADRFFDLAREQQVNFGVEMMDIDYFKTINDRYGHRVGDEVLICVAEVLGELRDAHTEAVRFGGDEFMILCRGKSDGELLQMSEDIRRQVKKRARAAALPDFTISQGICNQVPIPLNRSWDFTSAADNALYACKRRGRNQTILIHHPKDLEGEENSKGDGGEMPGGARVDGSKSCEP